MLSILSKHLNEPFLNELFDDDNDERRDEYSNFRSCCKMMLSYLSPVKKLQWNNLRVNFKL